MWNDRTSLSRTDSRISQIVFNVSEGSRRRNPADSYFSSLPLKLSMIHMFYKMIKKSKKKVPGNDFFLILTLGKIPEHFTKTFLSLKDKLYCWNRVITMYKKLCKKHFLHFTQLN